jgi:hypothetical protein
LNNWKVVGYICLGVGSAILIYGLFVFLDVNSTASINPILAGQIAFTTALHEASPYFVGAIILYIVGGVGLYIDSNYEESEKNYSEEITDEDLFNRLKRLEEIVDNNFKVITKRLDGMEEKQIMASQDTIIKAKKE